MLFIVVIIIFKVCLGVTTALHPDVFLIKNTCIHYVNVTNSDVTVLSGNTRNNNEF